MAKVSSGDFQREFGRYRAIAQREPVIICIAPVTHTLPREGGRAIEIAVATKARLRLDDECSWIITTEINRFIWLRPDLRSVPGGGLSYGLLPRT